MLMGLQLIVKADRKKIEQSLESLASGCEIFSVTEGLFGISIPKRILSSGDDVVLHKLEHPKRFDLWQGGLARTKATLALVSLCFERQAEINISIKVAKFSYLQQSK